MIKIDRAIIAGIQSATCAADLYFYLEQAVKLEHSTIPPYLTAMFSLKRGTNDHIGALIHSIVIQEMLHMTIAANVLVAIGGKPPINTKPFVPDYPGSLPMAVPGLVVGIEAFSIPLVKNVFMAIEEPENPIPVRTEALTAEEFKTIGAFYEAIQEKIKELGPSIFSHPTAPPQVVSHRWFGEKRLFPITSPDSACRAIDIIKIEGEGTSSSPFESPGEPAHYYRFGEIAAGKTLIKTPTGYAYGGAPIPFDPTGVWPLKPNCKIADFKGGTQARTRIEEFAYNYSSLLNALHDTFNGHPGSLDTAIGVMYDLRVVAVALMQTEIGDGSGLTVGPSFEYVQTQGGMN